MLKKRARRIQMEVRRLELTLNMLLMSVTPEVSQLEMSMLNFLKPEKSPLMSEMNETLQPAMGPYVAIAEVASVSNSLAAAFKMAVLVKV